MDGSLYGYFWNAENDDREYDADSFSMWLKKFFTTGVFNGDLETSATNGMGIVVSPGYANIEGKVRFFDAETNFTIAPSNSTYPRIDTVVVRCDYTNRQIVLDVVKGQYGGNSPIPTPPVRNTGLYELVIAEIYVEEGATSLNPSNISDKRMDADVCGLVSGTVEQADFSMFQAQFESWFANLKNILDENVAARLQNEIDGLTTRLTSAETRLTNAESDISTLNTNLTHINVYVGSDKKLHFVDSTGADSVLPFSSGLSEYQTGSVTLNYPSKGTWYTTAVRFSKAFSKVPTVYYKIGGDIICTTNSITVNGFNFMFTAPDTTRSQTASWFAYVPN